MGVQLQRHQEVRARAPQAARVVLPPAPAPDQAPALVPAQDQVHLIQMICLALVLAQAARVALALYPVPDQAQAQPPVPAPAPILALALVKS